MSAPSVSRVLSQAAVALPARFVRVLLLAALPLGVGHAADLAPHAAAPAANVAPAPAAPTLQEPAPVADPVIKLGVGDTVAIDVYGKPELKTTTYVSDDGSVLVPLAGAVPVAGLSPAGAATRIANAYKQGEFLVNPQVSITVVSSRSRQMSVLGQVVKEGRYTFESNSTVFDVLALAGGRKEEGARVVYLLRTDARGTTTRTPIDLDSLADPTADLPQIRFEAGDTLYVPRASHFYVQGEVTSPNQYLLDGEMTVMEAIARAGGITRRGSSSRIEIKRRQPDGSYVTVHPKPTDRVQADDVIRVKESIF